MATKKTAAVATESVEDVDVSRRFVVRKTVVLEYTWILPEGIGSAQEAKALADDEGEVNAHEITNAGERWSVARDTKSDVVRRLFQKGLSATEIAKATGWDYTFVYGVSWRDASPRGMRGTIHGDGI